MHLPECLRRVAGVLVLMHVVLRARTRGRKQQEGGEDWECARRGEAGWRVSHEESPRTEETGR